jgi:hypothetical protein
MMKEYMNHTTQIIRTEQLSDEALGITIRCCGDPLTDSALTIYGVGKLSSEQMANDIDKHHDRVAAKCAAMARGKYLVDAMGSKSKTHGGK